MAALGEQTLKVCARRTRGTVVWLAGPRTIAEHLAPILHAAAVEADVTSPQIVAALPVVVTDDETATRNRLSTMLAAQGALPSYRSLLDRERADGPGDVAIVGDEAAVRRQISAMFDAGATEFCAVEVGANTDEVTRTRAVLRALNGAS